MNRYLFDIGTLSINLYFIYLYFNQVHYDLLNIQYTELNNYNLKKISYTPIKQFC